VKSRKPIQALGEVTDDATANQEDAEPRGSIELLQVAERRKVGDAREREHDAEREGDSGPMRGR
jgi:hypothetical protein